MLHVHVNFHVHIYRNAEIPDFPAPGQSGTGMKKLTMPEQVQYRTRLIQSGIFLVRFWTKIRDAGMQMLALVYPMPMPSCGAIKQRKELALDLKNAGFQVSNPSIPIRKAGH